MPTWNTAFEAAPADDVVSADFEDSIRELKTAFMERFEKEHAGYVSYPSGGGTVSADGRHLPGSAKAYLDSALPTLRPDGTLISSIKDSGRLACLESAEGTSLYAVNCDGAGLVSYEDLTGTERIGRAEVIDDTASILPSLITVNEISGWIGVGDPIVEGEVISLPAVVSSGVSSGPLENRGQLALYSRVFTVSGATALTNFGLRIINNSPFGNVYFRNIALAVDSGTRALTPVTNHVKRGVTDSEQGNEDPFFAYVVTPIPVGTTFRIYVEYGRHD